MVHVGPREPGKSWNLNVSAFFQDWKVLEKVYWSWNIQEICWTQEKNVKCMADSKEK